MPPHHHHHHGGRRGPPPGPPKPPNRLIEKLRALQDVMQYPDIELLAQACERIRPGGADAAGFLRAECATPNVELAIAKLEISLWEGALARQQMVCTRAAEPGASGVIIAPVPPHLFRDLLRMRCNLSAIILDGHELPPGPANISVCRDPIEARRLVRSADLIVFDAFAGEDTVVARQALVDLLDPAILRAEVQLAVHFRPHRKPEDVPLHDALAAQLIEL